MYLNATCLDVVVINIVIVVGTIIVKEVISTTFLLLILLRSLLVDSITKKERGKQKEWCEYKEVGNFRNACE
jgi:hypothetical protein